MYHVLCALALLSGLQLDNGAKANVLVFLRTDCPLANRYAPELQRLAQKFEPTGVRFWLVYPGREDTDAAIRKQIGEYHLPGSSIRDSDGAWVRHAHVTVSPEAAVFNNKGVLVYHGRIDNRWVDFGKARPAATVHELDDAVTAVLAGRAVAHSETRAVGCSLADVE
jgi:hypothetical protein